MKRGLAVAGALVLLAIVGWRAARHSPPAAFSGSPEALMKLKTLREILASRNDNDHRLDTDFNALSPEVKSLFREEYAKLPPERRNERGTVVFLLGQNLTAPEDWAFLHGVLNEPPCLSLADCSKSYRPGEEDAGAGDEVTLAYPALVALKAAEGALEAAKAGPAAANAGAWSVLKAGRLSKTPAVARLADRLLRQRRQTPH